MLDTLETLKKSIIKNTKELVLIREENLKLHRANEELSSWKKCKKKLLKLEGLLSVAKGYELLNNAELYT